MARLRSNTSIDFDAAPAPLRYDAPLEVVDPHADPASEGYRAPRDGFLRTFRGALLLGGVCVALGATTWLAWTPALEGIARGASALAGREGDGQTQLSVTVGLGAVALLGFAVAWGRATHPRRPVRLSGDRGRMAVDAIAGGLRDALLGLHAVREAGVQVTNHGRDRVLVRVSLRVDADARIDDTLDGVDDMAAWLVQDRLGLLLAEPPMVDVRYDELDLRAARASAAARGLRDGDE